MHQQAVRTGGGGWGGWLKRGGGSSSSGGRGGAGASSGVSASSKASAGNGGGEASRHAGGGTQADAAAGGRQAIGYEAERQLHKQQQQPKQAGRRISPKLPLCEKELESLRHEARRRARRDVGRFLREVAQAGWKVRRGGWAGPTAGEVLHGLLLRAATA